MVTPEEIAIDDFQKVDLRVAVIKTAERVPNTDKLMKITVDMAGRERIIVSGIAQYYEAKGLIGKNVIVVANLKPAKLKGIESRGMLLAASDGKGETSSLPKCRELRRAARSNNGTTSLFLIRMPTLTRRTLTRTEKRCSRRLDRTCWDSSIPVVT